MFWGPSEHPFTSLVAFVVGVQTGGGPELVPHGSISSLPKGWMTFIREHTTSEKEAFELFFRLREEYDQKHPA